MGASEVLPCVPWQIDENTGQVGKPIRQLQVAPLMAETNAWWRSTDAELKPMRRRLLFAGTAAAGAVLMPAGMRSRWLGMFALAGTGAPEIDPVATIATSATIALGDPARSHLGSPGASIDHQRVGADFHRRRWPFDQLDTVRYVQGSHDFEVPRVSSLMGFSDRDDPRRGIYAWGINAFPTASATIAHALARDDLFRLFAKLRDAGWRRYFDVGDPRLSGRQTMRYFLEQEGNYSTDPAYAPTLDEWMRLNEHLPSWQFWADGTYMTVSVIDEPSLRKPDRPGVYMYSIDLESESAHFQAFFTEVEDMKRWKLLIPAELERLHKLRVAEEAELQRRGYTIDTSYRDPPILALGQS